MKILYLKLENFATIYTAMGKKKISIDFTESKNKIILFVGPNGSGKTSILSTLHPFAYTGSMDVRSNSSIIIDGKDGYKEIHIQDDDNIYTIQHYYKYSKNGIAVKSFIQKNGVELNPNGNVTSFNETIRLELSLEQDFLRLLRLGSNVSNLIDMKASERKSFTSDLLSDINIYNELFKKVSDDNRLLRSMIKTVTDKISRLNVVDIELLKKDIEDGERVLKMHEDDKLKTQKKIGKIEGQITALVPEGITSLDDEISTLEREHYELKNEISEKESILNKFCIVVTAPLENMLSENERKCVEYSGKLQVNNSKITFYKEMLSELYNRLSSVEEKEKIYTSLTDYAEVHDLHMRISEEIKTQEKKFKDNEPIYTKDNLMTLLGILKEIDFMATKIYEHDDKLISEVVSLIKNGTNVQSFVTHELFEVEKKLLKNNVDVKQKVTNPIVLFKPSNCVTDKCPYLYLYDVLFSDEKSNESNNSLEDKKEALNEMREIDNKVSHIFRLISSNKYLIDKGNIPYFRIENILNNLSHFKSLYNEDVIVDMISIAEEYESYISNKSKLKEITAELKLMNSNKSTIDEIVKEKNSISIQIADTLNAIRELESENKTIEREFNIFNEQLDILNRYIEVNGTLSSDKEKLNCLSEKIASLKKRRSEVTHLESHKIDLMKELRQVEFLYNEKNKQLMDLMFSMREFKSLSEERDLLNREFEDVAIIKESLSSTKGIPLLFIQLYLKNTKMYVNELLNIVFGGEFEIDDFDISSTEFNIPYIKNNVRINDVVYASQGERSFLSLALSFALIVQSIKRYNIILLDEIDATLDTKNRAMFLNILEKQMEMTDSEQVFLITHNNMFDNYAVDIVLTGESSDKYQNANIIHIG